MKKGHIEITGARQGLSTQITVRVDVFRPIVHVDVKSNKSVHAKLVRYLYLTDQFVERLRTLTNSVFLDSNPWILHPKLLILLADCGSKI